MAQLPVSLLVAPPASLPPGVLLLASKELRFPSLPGNPYMSINYLLRINSLSFESYHRFHRRATAAAQWVHMESLLHQDMRYKGQVKICESAKDRQDRRLSTMTSTRSRFSFPLHYGGGAHTRCKQTRQPMRSACFRVGSGAGVVLVRWQLA